MKHVMLDLETLGTRPGCPVLSIGAVLFDADLGVMEDRFHAYCRLDQQFEAGLMPEAGTLAWWAKQAGVAELFENAAQAPPGLAFAAFSHWFPADVLVWGNGADFDMPILAHAMKACGYRAPWKPFSGRCFRSLKNLYPHVPKVNPTEAHNALSDAVAQAQWAINIAAAGAVLA